MSYNHQNEAKNAYMTEHRFFLYLSAASFIDKEPFRSDFGNLKLKKRRKALERKRSKERNEEKRKKHFFQIEYDYLIIFFVKEK